ncbi:MFS transporter [Halorarum halophilum]|uniref:Lysosomal dipeptide transporter MFSD1 n=1 Tax=Halorarum halophilum TaxID=2743090 RepID=A0A7D5KWJ4_9EURY|nr:MFS transporter [Halobaculum halophilum]QLG26758.1 MFS transporter [Halobaculum halophilum]
MAGIDRGHAMWLVLACGFLFVNFFRNSTAVLAGDLAAVFDATAAELGLLHSSFFYIYAAAQLPAGLVADRYGPRRVVAGGLVGMAVGVAVFAASGSLAVGFLGRALAGLGGSVIYVAVLRFCANWFASDEFATMTGFTIAAAGMGGILATTPLAIASDAAGWRPVMFGSAAAMGVVAVGVYAAVRDRPDDARVEAAADGSQSLGDVIAGARRVLSDLETWLMGIMLFLVIGLNFTVVGLWGVPYMVHVHDVSVATAATTVLAANVGFALGSPVLGALSDRLGRRTEVILASCLVFLASYAVVFLTVAPPLVVVGAVLFVAMFVTGGTAVSYTVAKERHLDDSGAATGTVNGLGYLGAAVFPAVMGLVLDAYWTGEVIDGARAYTPAGYRVAFGVVTLGGVVAVGCALALHVRERRRTNAEAAAGAD